MLSTDDVPIGHTNIHSKAVTTTMANDYEVSSTWLSQSVSLMRLQWRIQDACHSGGPGCILLPHQPNCITNIQY